MNYDNNFLKDKSPINFPCEFLIKVMGSANLPFEDKVFDVVRRHFPDLELEQITRRYSKNNNYIALTITLYAESKSQLDALYLDLHELPEVLVVL